MSRRDKNSSSDDDTQQRAVDVVDGIPDRSPHRSAWKYMLMAAVFVLWVGFLIYCATACN